MEVSRNIILVQAVMGNVQSLYSECCLMKMVDKFSISYNNIISDTSSVKGLSCIHFTDVPLR